MQTRIIVHKAFDKHHNLLRILVEVGGRLIPFFFSKINPVTLDKYQKAVVN